eukprot:979874-Amphidinium_carterae.1
MDKALPSYLVVALVALFACAVRLHPSQWPDAPKLLFTDGPHENHSVAMVWPSNGRQFGSKACHHRRPDFLSKALAINAFSSEFVGLSPRCTTTCACLTPNCAVCGARLYRVLPTLQMPEGFRTDELVAKGLSSCTMFATLTLYDGMEL